MSEPEHPQPQTSSKFGQTLFSLRTTLLITFCIFALLFAAGARDMQNTAPTPTPTSTPPPPLGTPMSTLAAQSSSTVEIEIAPDDSETTTGLILGAILLLLIIIIGTLAVIRNKEN
ncbi:MAG: hypothetical protein AAGU05_05570 [Anaerolineaceae bacterium]